MDDVSELIGSEGCGSMIVEIAFALAGLPVALTDLAYLEPGPGRDRLLALNPLGQVPTLVLPDGTVLTESAAMILHLADRAPQAGLLPPPGAPERAAAQNTLVALVAAVYPTFTFGDTPERFAGEGPAAALLKERLDDRRKTLWRQLDARLSGGSPFAYGDRPTAVDLYLSVMVYWRPGRDWFRAETPRLSAIADRVAMVPTVRRVFERHRFV